MKTRSHFYLIFTFCIITFVTKAQVDVNDSLALVDLYNSTNGSSWLPHGNNSNWLTGPVKNWYGVSLTSDGKGVIEINLQGDNLDGFIPSSLGNLSHLNHLFLNQNKLSGNIPPELGKLSNLTALSFSGNKLSGNIPPELGKLSSLNAFLDLAYNQLSGNIPPELGNLSNLQYLYLYYNQLSGSIPPELSNLSNLLGLHLSTNQLSGSIPSELGNLKDIQTLDLSYNKLNGNIPPELSKFSNLVSLDLSHNKLSGNIPTELGNISWYISSCNCNDRLDLSYNKLSGTIPSFIANLTYFNELDLSHNQFTFDGMELIAQKIPFAKYNFQALIPVHLNNNALSVSAGGTLKNNTYLWYKQGGYSSTTIKGDSIFHPTESGVYFVIVTNKIAKRLILTSRTIKYPAPPSLNAIASNKQLQFSNKIFSVYPNPAKNILHVQATGNASVSLLSLSGEILLTENINNTGSINIASIPAGVYYLKNNNTNASEKVVIAR